MEPGPGVRPSAAAFSSLMMSTAAAPSLICEELPAVTLPSGLKAGFRLARTSAVVSGRIPSSVAMISLVSSPSSSLDGEREDLVLEATLGRGPGGELLAAGAEGVEVLAREVPLVGDHLGRDALGHETATLGVALHHLGAEGEPEVADDRRSHGRVGHVLDPGRDHHVVGAGHDALGGEVQGLLGGPALAVDGGGRHRLGVARPPARRCGRC